MPSPFDRDRGLRRAWMATRGLMVAALAATGVVSAVVAHARPGHSGHQVTVKTLTPSGDTSPSTSTSPPTAPSDQQSQQSQQGQQGQQGALSPPAQLPVSGSGSGSVSSGGS